MLPARTHFQRTWAFNQQQQGRVHGRCGVARVASRSRREIERANDHATSRRWRYVAHAWRACSRVRSGALACDCLPQIRASLGSEYYALECRRASARASLSRDTSRRCSLAPGLRLSARALAGWLAGSPRRFGLVCSCSCTRPVVVVAAACPVDGVRGSRSVSARRSVRTESSNALARGAAFERIRMGGGAAAAVCVCERRRRAAGAGAARPAGVAERVVRVDRRRWYCCSCNEMRRVFSFSFDVKLSLSLHWTASTKGSGCAGHQQAQQATSSNTMLTDRPAGHLLLLLTLARIVPREAAIDRSIDLGAARLSATTSGARRGVLVLLLLSPVMRESVRAPQERTTHTRRVEGPKERNGFSQRVLEVLEVLLMLCC